MLSGKRSQCISSTVFQPPLIRKLLTWGFGNCFLLLFLLLLQLPAVRKPRGCRGRDARLGQRAAGAAAHT